MERTSKVKKPKIKLSGEEFKVAVPKSKKTQLKNIRKRDKKESEVPGENLLLSYTYYLDHCHNQKITLGFDTFSFEAKIVFHRHGRLPVSTFYSGWQAVYKHLTDLKGELYTATVPANQEELLTEYKIPVDLGSVHLTLSELYNIFDILDFLNIVMFHNNNAVESVKEYYKKYCEKCKSRNLILLSNEDFFIPSRTSYVHLNYSRLFFEIPLYCNINIIFDVITI